MRMFENMAYIKVLTMNLSSGEIPVERLSLSLLLLYMEGMWRIWHRSLTTVSMHPCCTLGQQIIR